MSTDSDLRPMRKRWRDQRPPGSGGGPRDPRQGQRGLALIVVLWTLVLVSLLAAQVLGRTTQNVRLARGLVDRSAAELAADGAVRFVIASLLASGEDPFDGATVVRIGDSRVGISIEDEAGRVDLNAASTELFEALLLALSVPAPEARRSADLLVAFRAADAGAPEQGAGFEFPLDLARVPGLDETVRRLMMPYVTTFTGIPPTASTQLRPVRRALEMLEQEGDAVSNQGSWTVFALAFGAERGTARLPERIFRITAAATGPSGARFARTAVVAIQPGSAAAYRVLSWQRNWSEI